MSDRSAGAFAGWILVACAMPAVAADTRQPHGVVPLVMAVRANAPIHLDGRLDEEPWVRAAPATDFRQRDPDEGKSATERTELRIAFDDNAVYIGARMYDSTAARIVRRLSRRDDLIDVDRITIYLDPRLDHLTGAAFDVTAAGSVSDAIIYNDSWTDTSWDAVWEAAVSVDAEGWTAELRVPFSQLRFSTANVEAWGINVSRFIVRKNEEDWLELVPKKETGLASRMAHLVGIRDIKPPRRLELLPYTVGRAEFIGPRVGDPFNDGSRLFAGTGLDMKYGLTSAFTLAATVNPDFGQVEVDPAVVNLTAFETFFEERRPFFIEGAQTLQNFGRGGANSFWGFNNAEPDLFYSRRIGRMPQGSAPGDFVDRPPASTILGAAKLSGKTSSGWTIGLLEAVTGREHAHTSTGGALGSVEVEPPTNYFVARVLRELRRAGFGALATSVNRSLGGSPLADRLPGRATVVGGDAYVFLDAKRDWVITGGLSGSRISGTSATVLRAQRASQRYFQRPDRNRLDPDATAMSGWAGRVNLNRNNGVWRVNAALWGISPGFEANDLGFSSRSGINGAHAVLQWRKPTPNRWSRSRNVWAAKWWTWDADRHLQGDGYSANASATLKNYWSVGGGGNLRLRTTDDWLTRGGPAMTSPAGRSASLRLGSDSRRRLAGDAYVSRSTNEFGGWGRSFGLSLTLKPSTSLSISSGPEVYRTHALAQYVAAVADQGATETYGSRYVFSTLDQTEVSMTTRVTWVMTPVMSLQVYAQPLISAGDYAGFKSLARPNSFEFVRYPGDAPPLELASPDFNFRSLRVNAVYRWEWRLGSTLYVVWTDQRQDAAMRGDFALGRDSRALVRAPGDDVLVVKISYWLSR